MEQHAFNAGWDLFLFGIPLIAFLVFGYFRLDQVFTTRKDAAEITPPMRAVIDPTERSMRTDPDGRSWDEPRKRA